MDRSRTKQVCTIGPASASLIGDLISAGMDVARINFSHGTPDDHRTYVHAVRSAAHAARRSVAVMIDLPGPKIRLGELDGGEARLEPGSEFSLYADAAPTGTNAGASVPHASLATQLQVGDRVLLADGAAELRVTAVDAADVRTEVVNGGIVRSRAGVNIPSERLSVDGLTEEDRAAIPRALELRADLIAQSFVRGPEDVRALRALLPADGPRIVAKIETRAAIENFEEICAEADGIMVARGDLGVDVPFEDVPVIQKDLVERASNADKFTIVATQMLESMTGSPRPTRAEASDVANAVLDGADAVMLSAETAIGAYPVEALKAMERICSSVDDRADFVDDDDSDKVDPSRAMVLAAASISGFTDAGAIWCFTRTGRTAEMLSMTRPRVPIVAFTLSPIVARRLAVRRGVTPLVLAAAGKAEPLIQRMEAAWRAQRSIDSYDTVLLVTTSIQPSGINRLEILRLGAVPAPAAKPAGTAAREARPPRPAPEPVAAQQSEPAAAEPVVAEPLAAAPEPEPAAAEPVVAEPAAPEPVAVALEAEPAIPEVVAEQPADDQPVEVASASAEASEETATA